MADSTLTDPTASTASTTRTATSLLVSSRKPSRPPRFRPSRRLTQEKNKLESTRTGQLRALERL